MGEDETDQASDQSVVLCPSCDSEVPIVAGASIPPTQKLTMELTTESKYFGAEVIGEMIKAQSDVLVEVARCLGATVCVFVTRIELTDHKIEIDFVVATGT